ncbi:DUF4229 domain-containing protein [Embleya sp. NPDC020630]|uniref:DUF4229 domain-containing protein n=1 Tax=unclassified Embleya TaxID=2699296 RepID=UPI0037B0AD86
MSNPALRYSLFRLGIFAALFAAAMGVFSLFDMEGGGNVFIAIAIAAGLSAVISYRFLDAQREAMSEALYNRVQAAKARIAEDNRAEDEATGAISPRAREAS